MRIRSICLHTQYLQITICTYTEKLKNISAEFIWYGFGKSTQKNNKFFKTNLRSTHFIISCVVFSWNTLLMFIVKSNFFYSVFPTMEVLQVHTNNTYHSEACIHWEFSFYSLQIFPKRNKKTFVLQMYINGTPMNTHEEINIINCLFGYSCNLEMLSFLPVL